MNVIIVLEKIVIEDSLVNICWGYPLELSINKAPMKKATPKKTLPKPMPKGKKPVAKKMK